MFHSYAQQDGRGQSMTPEARATMQTNHMEQQLGFDASLRDSIYAINLKFSEEQKTLRDSGVKGPDRYEKMKVLHEERMSSLKELLTVEQFSALEEMHAKRKAQKKGKRRGSLR